MAKTETSDPTNRSGIGMTPSHVRFAGGEKSIAGSAATARPSFAKGTLEAVYTGGNLSTSQIQSMTTGDGSTTAMNNQMWSYWGDNTVPPLQA